MHGGATNLRLSGVERYIRACPDRYMVTLTTKRRLDDIAMASEVSRMFHRVNTALYGTHYSRRKRMRLATLAMQERSLDQGLHTHVLIGVPEGSLTLKAIPCALTVPQLILTTWVGLDDRGRRSAAAQDAQDIYDFDGARRYVMKEVRSKDHLTNCDYINTITPDV